ncbi:DUF6602 domain-containing protein [Azohydromonas australica]|uniref:DUF6602 domain-containing protein n=1 Tax=Azohydromonas australica TaxID=364039 RepID=UPI0012EB25EA|nr:DUF6602 domain-containing protein [Azohydromonas australica]
MANKKKLKLNTVVGGSPTNNASALGKLDLERLFQVEAMELLGAVDKGAVLHGSYNIRDSGASIESAFRNILDSRLPSIFGVMQGYLFDDEVSCTPQIDCIVTDAEESHEILKSIEGSTYAPFTCALAVFEIKNTCYDFSAAFDQVLKINKIFLEMKNRGEQRKSQDEPGIKVPISILLFGKTDDCSLLKIQSLYEKQFVKNPNLLPHYTILLDKGIVLAHRFGGAFFTFPRGELKFDEYESRGCVHIFTPKKCDDLKSGRVLLWLYFAVVFAINRISGKNLKIKYFLDQFQESHGLISAGELSKATTWP